VFGDSLSDVGNAHAQRGDAAFACPPHWQGRRCDGPLWVEGLAAGLGLPPLRHSLAGGQDHAFGGARSGEGVSPKGLPNLLTQVQGFLTSAAADRPVASALVVLRAGANDYLDAPPTPDVGAAVNGHLLRAVETLADAGLLRFLVPSELPWGFSPIQLPGLGPAERQGLNRLIARQNADLRLALAELAVRRGLLVWQPDLQALFLALRADPVAYGYTEIERPVLGPEASGGTAAVFPARGHLWWDSWAHLSAAFHALMAQQALAALRSPAGGVQAAGV